MDTPRLLLPSFSFLLILLIIRSLIFYFIISTTFVVM